MLHQSHKVPVRVKMVGMMRRVSGLLLGFDQDIADVLRGHADGGSFAATAPEEVDLVGDVGDGSMEVEVEEEDVFGLEVGEDDLLGWGVMVADGDGVRDVRGGWGGDELEHGVEDDG